MLPWTGRGLYKIGVIGGICSGKSTILKYLESNDHIEIIHLDNIGHKVLRENSTVIEEIEKQLGTEIYLGGLSTNTQDEINDFKNGLRVISRRNLSQLVFSDYMKLMKLNRILWPAIAKVQQRKFDYFESSGITTIGVAEGAVIIEAGYQKYYHDIWCVSINPESALRRLMMRNPELSESEARERITSQLSDEEREKHASFM